MDRSESQENVLCRAALATLMRYTVAENQYSALGFSGWFCLLKALLSGCAVVLVPLSVQNRGFYLTVFLNQLCNQLRTAGSTLE